tara:strand:- start:1175 stop:2032 length:858 start_codon:yes stop_codon:yes gene_type:complete
MWVGLFKTVGSNPENLTMVIKRCIEINQRIIKEGYQIKGASATFSRKGAWSKHPKLTLQNSNGKKHVDLPKPSAPREAKMIIAMLYSLCHMNSVIDNAHVFYNDKKGLATSIASKHGPQKSEYMKSLIRNLNDESLIHQITESIEHPLPSELTALQRAMIKNLKEGYLPHDIACSVMKKFECDARDLEDEIEKIIRTKGITERHIPVGITWETISFLDHTDLEQKAIQTAVHAAEKEIDSLSEALEASEEKHAEAMANAIHHLEGRIEFLENRNLIARILNKVKM